jgi:hypothetical protein|tara:strand:+ start:530 stop:775 length:246 start_codon:yes stop_codon:yes gene_type:complete
VALSKTVLVDKIEILEMGQIQVRTATCISEDGVELSRSFHRHVLEPGADTSGQEARVIAVANATWTDEVVADWETYLASLS